MCISSWCPDKDPTIEKTKTKKQTNSYLKLLFVDVPYAFEHIQQRGKEMHAACFPGCHFRSTLTQRKSPFGCVQLHLENKTLLSWDSFSCWPAELQPPAPTPVSIPQAGQCTGLRLWRCFLAGCCCWRGAHYPSRAGDVLYHTGQ